MKVGQGLTFFCKDWTYAGCVISVQDNYVILDPCWMIFDYGMWSDPEWKTYERIPTPWCVQKNSIESWGAGKALPSTGLINADAERDTMQKAHLGHTSGSHPAGGLDE